MTVPASGALEFDISVKRTLVHLSAVAGIYEANLDWIERGGKPELFGIKPACIRQRPGAVYRETSPSTSIFTRGWRTEASRINRDATGKKL